MSNLFDPEDIQPIEWMTQLNYTNPFSDRHRQLVRQLLDQTRQPRPSSYADIVERRNQQSTAIGVRLGLWFINIEKSSASKRAAPRLTVSFIPTSCSFFFLPVPGTLRSSHRCGHERRIWRCSYIFALSRVPSRRTPPIGPFGENSPEIAELPIFRLLLPNSPSVSLRDPFIRRYSPSMVKLRSDVWESIFTHDMERYKRSLYRRMQKSPPDHWTIGNR